MDWANSMRCAAAFGGSVARINYGTSSKSTSKMIWSCRRSRADSWTRRVVKSQLKALGGTLQHRRATLDKIRNRNGIWRAKRLVVRQPVNARPNYNHSSMNTTKHPGSKLLCTYAIHARDPGLPG